MADTEILDNGWIGIFYSLPANPSRARVQIWRKLRKNGALLYQQGMAMLPACGHFIAFLQELKEEIEALGGKAVLARLNFLDACDNKFMVDRFNTGLSDEYGDINETVSVAFDKLEDRRKENHLDSACLNEIMATIRRLKKDYETVKLRDYYRLRLHERVEERIETLARTVQRYYDELKGKADPIG
jgi:hypothetical protein